MKTCRKAVFAVAVLTAFACSKENPANDNEGPKEQEGPVYQTLSISARTENPSPAVNGEEAKTYFKAYPTVWWTQNDVLTILPQDGEGKVTDAVGEATDAFNFTVSGWDGSLVPKYAVFNGSINYDASVSDGVVSAVLKDNQRITIKNSFSKYCSMMVGEMVQQTEGWSVEMKNVCALAKFTLTGEDVTKVVLADAAGTASLAGSLTIEMSGGVPVVKSVTDAKTSVALTPNIKDYETFPAADYYACVLPDVEFIPQFTITRSDGTSSTVTGKSAVSIGRSKVRYFGEIDNVGNVRTFESQQYTGTSGTEGRSWTNITSASAGSSDPFKISMNDGTTLEFTPVASADNSVVAPTWRRLGSTAGSDGNPGVINCMASGYTKLPEIEGFALSSVYLRIASGSESSPKKMRITGDTSTDSGLTSLYQGQENTWEVSGSDSYYFYTSSSSVYIDKMILTYKKK